LTDVAGALRKRKKTTVKHYGLCSMLHLQ